ncbi:DNA alkylation repair protein [Lacibacter sediminis]|uniref:DNA alkylation repair protein n=1 Tax=Lacibacter sediminis TaxID=2760713 RepID=A0A7G5XIV8_9BACT|nr:DNA alkylation repair protein [Lacibacter sediminis]QNA45411.1 DNA alkylation repair protein [Lacibacter sediminis]
MHSYLTPLIKLFEQHANAGNAEGMKAYMLHQFDFFGLKAPEWRKLSKEYFKKELPEFKEVEAIIKDCWQHPKREMQYVGIELLACYQKQWTKQTINIIEYILTHKSWWETVDHAATALTGPYFKKFPEQRQKLTGKWNKSSNFWLQRSSIMFQKMYKEETDADLLGKHILALKNSKEFFIQKAIGWALREYSKTDEKWVKAFVKKHSLSPLSEREALKRVSK